MTQVDTQSKGDHALHLVGPADPTNQFVVPSVSITTARTGATSKTNALGMRPMQERAWASGASRTC